jgi:membrane fusion protein, type I secretion system
MNPRFRSVRLPATGARRPLIFASLVSVVCLGGALAWSALAPLESAAMASGVLVVDSYRKTVAHLEGGVVKEVLVREHDQVEAGQVLIRLDPTIAQAQLDLNTGELFAAEALAARLSAERDGRPDVVFPKLLAQSNDRRAAEAVAAERRVFYARRDQLEGQTRILEQKSIQLDEQIRGLKAQIAAEEQQLKLIGEEIATVQQLFAKGLEQKPKLLALQRQQADIEGTRGQNIAKVAEAKQQQGEAQLRVIDLKAQMLSDDLTKLTEQQTKISDLQQKIRAAEDTLKRIDITAPVAGQVQGLKVFTVGGVIAPRDALMDIVPRDDTLAVDAQVAVTDIDVVRPGLPVTLKFTALNQRTTPTIEGTVSKVSADRTVDQKTNQPYYTVRIALGSTAELPKNISLSAGMPVETMIRTGSRTFLEYVAKPITDFAARGLHES